MPLPIGIGPTDGVFHPSIGAAATAVVSHAVAAALSSSALHDIVHGEDPDPGRGLLGVTAVGGTALASVIVHLAALESRVLGDGPRRGPFSPDVEASNAAVLAALKDRSLTSVADVLAVMNRIDAALPDGDGLKWFNHLYHLVTEGVGAHIVGEWQGPGWLDRLDLVFAELYFSGIEKCLSTPGGGPLSWRALLDVRRDHRIAPVQFALAGMSAHINRDLGVAVARTWVAQDTVVRKRKTPEFEDYLKVNQLLDAVEPKALEILCGSLLLSLDKASGRGADWTALQLLHAARDVAWSHAEALNFLGVESEEASDYIDGLDAVAAGCARAALIPVG
jgi:hypothetical protein